MANDIIVKRCCACQELKPLNEFNRERSKPDGHKYRCTKCSRIANLAYAKSEKGKATAKRWRQTSKGRAVSLANVLRWQEANTEKVQAQRRVHELVRLGTKPPVRSLACIRCGVPATQYHHHLGYDAAHTEEVVPVCYNCHPVLDNRSAAVTESGNTSASK